MSEIDSSSVEAIAKLARSACADARTQILGPDGRTYVALPDPHGGMQLKEIPDEGRLPNLPPAIAQRVDVASKQSLVDYVNAFKGPSSRLFANLGADGKGATITAVLDYHRPDGPADDSGAVSTQRPDRLGHTVVFTLRDSEEWTRWSKISSDEPQMSQTQFVRFLEENAADIEVPQGADILELARDFQAARKVNFSQALRSQTGDVSFEYTVEAEAKSKSGHVDVPNLFRLNIPVFYGEAPMNVLAYLRYSIGDGLKLGIQLHRPVFIRNSLFELIGVDVASATALPLHYGSYSNQR